METTIDLKFKQTRTLGIVCWDDISSELASHQPRVLAVDLETDRCNFSDPFFFNQSHTRLITVQDVYTGYTEFVRVDEQSDPVQLRRLLERADSVYFHHAMFDLTFLAKDFDIWVTNPRCTYILARALRGAGRLRNVKIGLKPLLEHYFEIPQKRFEALSDWSTPELTDKQLEYARGDVEYLHRLYEKMRDQVWVNSMASTDRLVHAHERHLSDMVYARLNGMIGVFEHLR